MNELRLATESARLLGRVKFGNDGPAVYRPFDLRWCSTSLAIAEQIRTYCRGSGRMHSSNELDRGPWSLGSSKWLVTLTQLRDISWRPRRNREIQRQPADSPDDGSPAH